MSSDPKHWLAAFITLGIYSFLFKENPFQKVGEYLVVGLGMAHSIVAGYTNVRNMAWVPLTTKGQWYMIIPIILGLLLWTRWFKQYAYLSRASIGLMVGVGAAVGLRGAIDADLFGQLRSAINLPLSNAANWVVLIGMFGTITQFMYIVNAPNPKTGRRGILSEALYFIATYIGQGTIMVALGAAYAFTIMGRVSIVIGRVQFLFRDWIHLLK
jgi:hypothetical protein